MDFPAPFLPSRPTRSPVSIWKDTPSSIFFSRSKDLTRSVTLISIIWSIRYIFSNSLTILPNSMAWDAFTSTAVPGVNSRRRAGRASSMAAKCCARGPAVWAMAAALGPMAITASSPSRAVVRPTCRWASRLMGPSSPMSPSTATRRRQAVSARISSAASMAWGLAL